MKKSLKTGDVIGYKIYNENDLLRNLYDLPHDKGMCGCGEIRGFDENDECYIIGTLPNGYIVRKPENEIHFSLNEVVDHLIDL